MINIFLFQYLKKYSFLNHALIYLDLIPPPTSEKFKFTLSNSHCNFTKNRSWKPPPPPPTDSHIIIFLFFSKIKFENNENASLWSTRCTVYNAPTLWGFLHHLLSRYQTVPYRWKVLGLCSLRELLPALRLPVQDLL